MDQEEEKEPEDQQKNIEEVEVDEDPDMDEDLEENQYTDLPKVDVVVQAPTDTLPATTNGTTQSLESLCA